MVKELWPGPRNAGTGEPVLHGERAFYVLPPPCPPGRTIIQIIMPIISAQPSGAMNANAPAPAATSMIATPTRPAQTSMCQDFIVAPFSGPLESSSRAARGHRHLAADCWGRTT